VSRAGEGHVFEKMRKPLLRIVFLQGFGAMTGHMDTASFGVSLRMIA
jgi:hypothetical protein